MSPRNRPRTVLANETSPTVRSSDNAEAVIRSLLVVTVLVLTVGTLPAATAVDGSTAQPASEIVIEDATVTPGEDDSVEIVLSDAPQGLAGFELSLAVESDEIAAFRGGAYPDEYGMTTDPVLEDDERTVTVEAADLDDEITPGATDVTIATIGLTGEAPGTTAVRVTNAQLDADDGDPIEATIVNGSLTVDDESAGDQETADGGGDRESLDGFGVIVGLAAVGCIAILQFVRRP